MNKDEIESSVTLYLKKADLNTTSLKTVIGAVETDLSLEAGSISSNKELKRFVKQLVISYSEKENLDSNVQEETEEKVLKKKVQSKKPKKRKSSEISKAKPKASISKKSPSPSKSETDLKKLNKMARAVGKGPAIFSNLPQDPRERVNVLSFRLKEADVEFNGKIPTEGEIKRAQEEYQKRKDMEGIDMSNIIDSSSRNRRRRKDVKYNAEVDLNLASDEEEDDQDEEVAQSSDSNVSNDEEENEEASGEENASGSDAESEAEAEF